MIRIVFDKTAQTFTFELEGQEIMDQIDGAITVELDASATGSVHLFYSDIKGRKRELWAKEAHIIIKEIKETKEVNDGGSKTTNGNEEEGSSGVDS